MRWIWRKLVAASTGGGYAEITVTPSEGPFPAMVEIEIDSGAVLAPDARRYALALLAAAEIADSASAPSGEAGR